MTYKIVVIESTVNPKPERDYDKYIDKEVYAQTLEVLDIPKLAIFLNQESK